MLHTPNSLQDPHIEHTTTPLPIKPSFRFMCKHPAHVIALGFGSGLSPKAPGTAGTLFAWLSFILLTPWIHYWTWAIIIAFSFVLGLWACEKTAKNMHQQDPGSIVWDEIAAFWLIMWFVMPTAWWEQIIAFGLFRLFDALKHGPVKWADTAFKGWGYKGAFGIMFDDIIAALLTIAVMYIGRFIIEGF